MRNIQISLLALLFLSLSCNPATKIWNEFNMFPVEQDIEIGKQVSQQIENDPKNFPILKRQGNEEVYQLVDKIKQRILRTGEVEHRDIFAWELKIIDDDETMNAFALPGGYMYVYTGLIKFLDREDQLAGVIGHEIAHAALRHSTAQMTKLYGVDLIIQLVAGDVSPELLNQIALQLTSLSFSRYHESQADLASVRYLCETEYSAVGAAGFFEKLEGQPQPPVFLSTHPAPDNRVEEIYKWAEERDCSTQPIDNSNYNQIKKLIR